MDSNNSIEEIVEATTPKQSNKKVAKCQRSNKSNGENKTRKFQVEDEVYELEDEMTINDEEKAIFTYKSKKKIPKALHDVDAIGDVFDIDNFKVKLKNDDRDKLHIIEIETK